MEKNQKNIILTGILFVIMLVSLLASAGVSEKKRDISEGGHLETDFGSGFMAEWWYLNGKATLAASEGEEKDVGFFVVFAHQESPMLRGLSQMLTFYGIYNDDKNEFNYTEIFIPRKNVSEYIAMRTPYVDYRYPEGVKKLSGSASTGYSLIYNTDNSVSMDIFFKPDVDNTLDQASSPLKFTAYERSHGQLKGSMFLNGKNYTIKRSEGYMDHMIPVSDLPWPMYMHGWNWFEVTTDNYQAVAYAVRSLDDGYGNYSFKHVTLLNKKNGKIISEYYGDEITINETGWIDETGFSRKRPSNIEFSTSDLRINLNAEKTLYLNSSKPSYMSGFVDFMAYQPDDSTINFGGTTDEGNAFYEYLVSDMGVVKEIR